ncbi:hypothetical protein Tco_1173546, partial [Tanacetum coccineum]
STARPPLLSATTITAGPPAAVPFAKGMLHFQRYPAWRSGKRINTISVVGEASSAGARLGYHVKFKDVIPLKVTYKPAPPRRKKTVGTTSHPEEERLLDISRLSNPYLEKRRQTFMMALSSGHFLILISLLVIIISFSQSIFHH